MILGFISLLLTFGQNYIAQICIPLKYGHTMLPCPDRRPAEGGAAGHHRRLLEYERRFLSGADVQVDCKPVRT